MTAKLPIVYNYQPFVKTRWVGQTDHSPSRVIATNLTDGTSVTVSWDYGLDVMSNHLAAAQALYKKQDAEPPAKVLLCGTRDQTGYIITSAES